MNSGMKKALFVSFIVATIMVVVWYLGLHKYFSLTALQENRVYLEEAVASNYIRSVAIFMAIFLQEIAN